MARLHRAGGALVNDASRQRGHRGPVEPLLTSGRAATVRKTGVATVGTGADTTVSPRPGDLDACDPVRDLGGLKGSQN